MRPLEPLIENRGHLSRRFIKQTFVVPFHEFRAAFVAVMRAIAPIFALLRPTKADSVFHQHGSPMFKLPYELRDEIYSYILHECTLTHTGISFIEVALTIGTTISVHTTCKRLRQEFKDAIYRSINTYLQTFASQTSIYPFQPGFWGEHLGTQGLCKICKPETYIKLGASHRCRGTHVVSCPRPDIPVAHCQLIVRIQPCACCVRTLTRLHRTSTSRTEQERPTCFLLEVKASPPPWPCQCMLRPQETPHVDRYDCLLATAKEGCRAAEMKDAQTTNLASIIRQHRLNLPSISSTT